jgi:lysophospholipase L1-like esterase
MNLRSFPAITPPRPPRLCVRSSFLPLFVTFCAFSWLTAIQPHSALAKDPAPAKPGPFAAEIAAFEKWDRQNAVPKDAILFVGSSSIRLWQTADAFPNLPVINRGFGGSAIAHVNRYADRIVLKYKPRLIVFYAGDNDIASGKSAKRVYDDFLEFVGRVRKDLPQTPIYFISIKPSIARLKLWPTMKEANSHVQNLARINPQVIYVDVATPMLGSNGKPRPELFREDGLHLNEAGYELWNKVLASKLAASLPNESAAGR